MILEYIHGDNSRELIEFDINISALGAFIHEYLSSFFSVLYFVGFT